MPLQLQLCREALIANGTEEWVFTRVAHLVVQKVHLATEWLPTHIALVWPLTCMFDLVHCHFKLLGKTFIAHITGMGLDLTVTIFVLGKILLLGKGLVAYFTLEGLHYFFLFLLFQFLWHHDYVRLSARIFFSWIRVGIRPFTKFRIRCSSCFREHQKRLRTTHQKLLLVVVH